MANQLDFSNLVKDMAGKDTVNNWDVLVSYPVDTINKMLKARSETMEKVLAIGPLDTSYEDPVTGDSNTITFSMKLNHPQLVFDDQYGNVTLTFNVKEGSYRVINEITFPPGLFLEVKAQLVAVSGKVIQSKSNNKPEFATQNEKKDIRPPNYTVIINPNDTGAATGVCIDLRKSTVTLKGKDEASQSTAKRLNIIIKGAIEDYFANAAAIEYHLAGVSNQYESRPADHALRPVSFCFTTVKGNLSNEVKSALCIWIAVQGGKGGGTKPTGNTQVTFHPGSVDLIPIPSGSTACIILSNYILLNQFFLPNLGKGFSDLKNTTVAGSAGLRFTGKLKAETVKAPKLFIEGSFGNYSAMDGIQFEPSDPLTDITISGDISSTQTYDKNKIIYKSRDQFATWIIQSGIGEGMKVEGGKVKLGFTWSAKGKWIDASRDNNPNLLGFQWNQDRNWKMSADAVKEWWNFFCSNEVPSHFRDLSVPGPRIDLTMDPLDYFLTTNLLFPGEQIFKADNPAGGSSSKGLAIPYDLIFTGNLIEAPTH